MSEIIRISPQVKVVKVSTGGGGSGSGVTSYNQLTEVPTTFPPSEHGHTIDEIDSLQTVLDGKAEYVHPHEIADITGLQDIIDGLGGGGGAVSSVAGRTGDVVLAKADVGLSNVDNTSDLSKPVSTATATALAGKSDTSHTHAIGAITGLGTGVATFLATPSSANLAAALTDETGTNALVFANNSQLTGSASIALGTITADAQALSITGAYNNAGVTFNGLLDVNLTSDSSNAASLLANFRVGGSSKTRIAKNGSIQLAGSSSYEIWSAFGGTRTFYAFDGGGGNVTLQFGQYGTIGWSSTTAAGSTDTVIKRRAAGVLALENGLNAQTFEINGTWATAGADYGRLALKLLGTEYMVTSERGGTVAASSANLFLKSANILYFSGGGNNAQWQISTSGHVLAQADNTYDIGASGASRPRTIRAGTNFVLGMTDSLGGGSKVMNIGDATTVPTTNPTGGGILYAEGGALKWRGSSGTVTTIAVA